MTNLDRVAGILAQRMQQTAKANCPTGLELGTMTEVTREGMLVLDLISDKLRQAIPCGSYSVLTGVELADGDRVVVAWIGHEPVVLGAI